MICDRKLYICDEDGNKFFGLGPMLLLEIVDETKSLHKASTKMGLSYHKALNIVKNAEVGFGCTLLEKKIGGDNGGGSQLTEEAHKIIALYRDFQKRSDVAIREIFEEEFKEYL